MFAKGKPPYFISPILISLGLMMHGACSEPRRETPVEKPLHTAAPVPVYKPDPDTLRIEDEFARSPFLLDSVSFTGVQKLMGPNVKVKKTLTRNHFVADQTDTLITLRKNGSYITLYAVSAEPKYFYKEAAINDPLPIFQNKVKIGQHKAEVKKLIPALKRTAYLPDNIEIAAAEGSDFVYLIFENDVLQRVDFKPYLD
jgi:hypothetical protein